MFPSSISIHTVMEHLHLGSQLTDTEVMTLRSQLEEVVSLWSVQEEAGGGGLKEATHAWQQYLTVTGALGNSLLLIIIVLPTRISPSTLVFLY